MIPQAIDEATDVCALAAKWVLDLRLAQALICMSGKVPFGIQIISGYRTLEQELELQKEGRPTPADPRTSLHVTCPSRAADLAVIGPTPNKTVKAYLGAAATPCGLRWGGGSPLDSDGLPSDWNHFDLGQAGTSSSQPGSKITVPLPMTPPSSLPISSIPTPGVSGISVPGGGSSGIPGTTINIPLPGNAAGSTSNPTDATAAAVIANQKNIQACVKAGGIWITAESRCITVQQYCQKYGKDPHTGKPC